MTSEQPIRDLHFQKRFCDEGTFKSSGSFDVMNESKTLASACWSSSATCPALPNQQLIKNVVTTVSSSYIKCIDGRSVLQDTKPVGTVMQKTLKVPEGQMSRLHSQAGD
jgi:hypothetical protein